jgi:rhodanese-related sulfurtransferase
LEKIKIDFEMIKQLASKEIKEYIKTKPNCILLDVRTNEEWNQIGKPDGEKIGLKTYLLPIEFGEARIFNENFIKEFKNLNVNQGQEILIICRSGIRSQLAAELLTKENYTCLNISDGFEGNNKNVGWKKCELPCQ